MQGEITFPPPPPKIQAIAAKPKEVVPELTPEEKRAAEVQRSRRRPRTRSLCLPWVVLVAGGWTCGARELHAALYRVCSGGLCRLPGDLGRGAQLCTHR